MLYSQVVLLLFFNLFILSHSHPRRLSCDEITCCPGKVCTLTHTGRSRCKYATSCDELECPHGLRCAPRRGKTPKGRVECRVSCDDINCPSFLECKARGRGKSSYAVCKPRKACPTTCPQGTTCVNAKRIGGVCLADSCSNVDCGNNTICLEGQVKGTSTGALKKFLRLILKGRGKRSHSRSSSTKGAKKKVEGRATCIPKCTNTTCPFGLVCEERKIEVRCRTPRTCEELNCPIGQICQITGCGKYSNRFPFPRTKSKFIIRCVDVTPQPTTMVPQPSTSEVASLLTSSNAETTVPAAETTVPAAETTVAAAETTVPAVVMTTFIDQTTSNDSPTPTPTEIEGAPGGK